MLKKQLFKKRPVAIIETPYAAKTTADYKRNQQYLHEACLDALSRGEAPFASHGFYTQFLDDTVPEERQLGMECGFNIMAEAATKVVVYVDLGITPGMRKGIEVARNLQWPLVVIERSLPAWQK